MALEWPGWRPLAAVDAYRDRPNLPLQMKPPGFLLGLRLLWRLHWVSLPAPSFDLCLAAQDRPLRRRSARAPRKPRSCSRRRRGRLGARRYSVVTQQHRSTVRMPHSLPPAAPRPSRWRWLVHQPCASVRGVSIQCIRREFLSDVKRKLLAIIPQMLDDTPELVGLPLSSAVQAHDAWVARAFGVVAGDMLPMWRLVAPLGGMVL